jgi:hypothetical protein
MTNWDNSPSAFSRVAGYSRVDYLTTNAYLFLRKELEVDSIEKYNEAYRTGKIRHCKPYRGRWLDYTAKKEFNTLEEWVADAGDTIENVLYGVNRVHLRNFVETDKARKFVGQTPKYVTLKKVLEYYGYVEPLRIQVPTYNLFDSFDDIAKALNINDLPAHGRSCLIKKPNGVLVIGRIVDQKYYELDDSHSKMGVSVPQDTQYEIRTYDNLSDMPAGTTVYFRSEDGCFRSIDELMKNV